MFRTTPPPTQQLMRQKPRALRNLSKSHSLVQKLNSPHCVPRAPEKKKKRITPHIFSRGPSGFSGHFRASAFRGTHFYFRGLRDWSGWLGAGVAVLAYLSYVGDLRNELRSMCFWVTWMERFVFFFSTAALLVISFIGRVQGEDNCRLGLDRTW
jgi:hypothetical protein